MSDREFYLQSDQDFFKSLGRKAGKIVKYSTLIRFAINVLMNRFNVIKALKDYKSVVRLGVGCAAFNILFNLLRRLFAIKRRDAK